MRFLSKISGMEDDFKIYVDRLREGREELIDFTKDPTFIGIPEEFSEPVRISGVAYLANEHLIMRLNIETKAQFTCGICSEPSCVPIAIKEFYQTVELAKIPHSVFNFGDLVRDAILLHIPHTFECGGGNCPHREELSNYFIKK